MSLYKNKNSNSSIAAMEFMPVSDGSFIACYAPSEAEKAKTKAWLQGIGQEIVAETEVEGKPVFVAHGPQTKDGILQSLAAQGDAMELYHYKPPFSQRAWKTGATLALIGQGMQLLASGLRPDRKVDWSLRMLAIPNLAATGIILAYGAQRTPDEHRLRYLKERENERMEPYLPPGKALPGVEERRSDRHKDDEPPPGSWQHVQGFLKRNSVVFGEIGLRYFGAIALAFPINKWGAAAGMLEKGQFREAYLHARNPSAGTHMAGIGSLFGKCVAIVSKAPDPFDPEPEKPLDHIREKYTFRTGGWIETAAFGSLALDAFRKKKISFIKGGREYRDFISGIGGTLFTIRYIIRHWAPFGVKEMDMKELNAHVTDSLAKMPPEKLPQLLADTAADLKNHFKDKPEMEFGKIFTQLFTEMCRYHPDMALGALSVPAGRMNRPSGTEEKRGAPDFQVSVNGCSAARAPQYFQAV